MAPSPSSDADEKISPSSTQNQRPSSSSTSTATASSYNEKDLEAGHAAHRRPHSSRPSSRSESLLSDYDEAVVRVTTQDDPARNDNVLGRLKSSLSRTTTRKTARTQEEVEAILGTEFEVKWAENDPENPQNWSMKKKAWIMGLVSMQTLIV